MKTYLHWFLCTFEKCEKYAMRGLMTPALNPILHQVDKYSKRIHFAVEIIETW